MESRGGDAISLFLLQPKTSFIHQSRLEFFLNTNEPHQFCQLQCMHVFCTEGFEWTHFRIWITALQQNLAMLVQLVCLMLHYSVIAISGLQYYEANGSAIFHHIFNVLIKSSNVLRFLLCSGWISNANTKKHDFFTGLYLGALQRRRKQFRWCYSIFYGASAGMRNWVVLTRRHLRNC